jgi:hypothetical protein
MNVGKNNNQTINNSLIDTTLFLNDTAINFLKDAESFQT